jgi:hypothetical protein
MVTGVAGLTLQEALAAQQVLAEHDPIANVELLQDMSLLGRHMKLVLRARHLYDDGDFYYFVAGSYMADAPYIVFFHEHAFFRTSLADLCIKANMLVLQAQRSAGDGYKYALG